MSSKFIRSRETFETAGIVTLMRFLSSVCTDVPRLMFKSGEGFVTEGAFVWAGRWRVRV
jgi:hypothetical protein